MWSWKNWFWFIITLQIASELRPRILPTAHNFLSERSVSTLNTFISQLFVLMKFLWLSFFQFSLPKKLLSPQQHYLSGFQNCEKWRVCFYMEKFPAHTFTSRGPFSLYWMPLNSQTTLRYGLCNIEEFSLQILQVHTPSIYRKFPLKLMTSSKM